MSTKIFLLVLLVSICSVLTFAQDDKTVTFDDSNLPKTATSTTKFVPAGWSIESTVSGDLNNDGIADAVIVFIEQTGERVLMIAFKNAKGEFERVVTAQNMLQCTTCGGALGGEKNTPDIKIAKGVLIINTLTGSRESSDQTFRFRYDPKVSKFALIGYDDEERDRGTGESTIASTNYLTGVTITRELQYNEKTVKEVTKSTKTDKVKTPTKYIEDVDYSEMGPTDTSGDGIRLTFKRGRNSTDIEGAVAKGDPNFYVIKAKAGQTMSISVTGKVTFGVAAPDDSFARDDSNTKWSKKLPADGDYKISIFTQESAEIYKLTVSFK